MFIGHEWLKLHNPSIDWRQSTIKFDRCPLDCTPLILPETPEDESDDFEEPMIEPGKKLLIVDFQEEIKIRAFQNISSKLAEEHLKGQQKKTFKESIPEEYHKFKPFRTKEIRQILNRKSQNRMYQTL